VDASGLYLANDARHVEPEAASLAIESGAFAGGADVLAGKAARNDVNTAMPWPSVKSRNVRPNWERSEDSIVLSLRQNLCGVGITFNCDHGSPSKEFAAEYSSTSAREKSQLIHDSPYLFPPLNPDFNYTEELCFLPLIPESQLFLVNVCAVNSAASRFVPVSSPQASFRQPLEFFQIDIAHRLPFQENHRPISSRNSLILLMSYSGSLWEQFCNKTMEISFKIIALQ
jgi:hypothetical protein